MLTHFLVEFYKAQIFFGFANAVAALTVARRGGLEPENLRELNNTYIFLKVSSQISNVLVSITWLMLFLSGQGSAFINILFSMILYLSVGLFSFDVQRMTAQDLSLLQKAYLGGPPECGGYKPWIWCSDDYEVTTISPWDMILSLYILSIYVVASVMLVVAAFVGLRKFIFDRMPNIVSGMESLKYWVHRRSKPELGPLSKVREIGWRARSIYLRNEVFAFLFPIIWSFLVGISIQTLQDFHEEKFYLHDWSFGQAVAILIWVPPLAELLNVEIRGLKKGLQSRVIKPYIVTIETTPEEVAQEDSDSDTELQAVRRSSIHDSHNDETTTRNPAIE